MQDALKLQAERMPGVHVDGWTDRPILSADIRPMWASYAEFVAWGEESPSALAKWVEMRHWREDAEGRALLFGVFLDLLADRIRSMPAQPVKEPSSD